MEVESIFWLFVKVFVFDFYIMIEGEVRGEDNKLLHSHIKSCLT